MVRITDLIRSTDTQPHTFAFAYYEGSWDKLPDFDKLKPRETGAGAAFDLAAARRGENYALKFDGFFRLDQHELRFSEQTSYPHTRIFVRRRVAEFAFVSYALTDSSEYKSRGKSNVRRAFSEAGSCPT